MEEYRCFVGGLAWSINSRSLEEAFRPYGDVVDCRVVSDRDSGRSRGFGFVTFGDEQGMRDAIEALNGTELDGRNIVVNQAQSRSGGGFRGGGGGGIRSGGYGAGFGNRGYGNGNGPREYDSERKNSGGFGAGYGGGRRGGRGGGRYGGRGGGGGDAGNSWK